MMDNIKIGEIFQNKWELFDEEKARRRIVIGLLLLVVIIPFTFILALIIQVTLRWTELWELSTEQLLQLTLLFWLIAVGYTGYITKRTHIDRRGWYFSAFYDNEADQDRILNLLRKVLSENNFPNSKEDSNLSRDLDITYFVLPTTEERVRLWYSKIFKPPVAEIGVGPENPSNRLLVERLKETISKELADEYDIQDEESGVGSL